MKAIKNGRYQWGNVAGEEILGIFTEINEKPGIQLFSWILGFEEVQNLNPRKKKK